MIASGDEPQLFEIHADPAVVKYSNSPARTRVEQATELVDASLKWLTSGNHVCPGIVRTGANEVVGTCTLFDIDPKSQRAELGFVLASHVGGQGYITEALTALLGHAFDSLHLNRIDADTDPRNTVSPNPAVKPTRNVMPHRAWLMRGAIAYGPARKLIVSTLPPRHGELGWWAFSGGSNIG